MTAGDFIIALEPHITEKEKEKLGRFYKGADPETKALGVRFGTVFKIAKEFTDMPLTEVERLLENDHYEVRMGAMAVLDFKARRKTITDEERRALYDLYMRRHDRIDNWDFVDRAAPHVVGGYLSDKPRNVLFELAASTDQWKRRTALYSTVYFIRRGEIDDTMRLAEMLIHDPEELVNKAVGTILREAGKVDQARLTAFLDRHAATMPRITLRYATEKLDAGLKERHMEANESASWRQ